MILRMLIVVFVTAVAAMCPNEAGFAQADSTPSYLAPVGKLVDIGGWSLHLIGKGLEINNGPTVIFENGIRGFSFDWIPIQQKIASFAKSYSYDRAGYAWSNLGPRPYTMQQTVYNLHTLLQKSGIPPPYIMVGASHGGLLVRLFARQYRGEVVGMVLVDAGYENGLQNINGRMFRTITEATGKPIPGIKTTASAEDNNLARSPEAVKAIGDALNKMGYPFKNVESPFDRLPDSLQKFRLWALSQYEFYVANDNPFIYEEKALMIKDRENQPYVFGDMPLIVLTAGKSGKPDIDPEEQERRQNQAAMTNLSRNSKQIIAESDHHIHMEQPGLVIDAIREIMESVNNKRKLVK